MFYLTDFFQTFTVYKVIQEFKVGQAPDYSWGVRAPTSNPLGKRLKLARKYTSNESLLHEQNAMDFNLIISNDCLNLKETIL